MRTEKKNLRSQARADIAVIEDALRRWDPICVLPGPNDDQGPMDEYDSYARQVLSMLMQGCDTRELQRWIGLIRTDSMGLKTDPASDSETARKLVTWWRSKSKP